MFLHSWKALLHKVLCKVPSLETVASDLGDAQVLALVVAAQVEEVALVPRAHDAAAGLCRDQRRR